MGELEALLQEVAARGLLLNNLFVSSDDATWQASLRAPHKGSACSRGVGLGTVMGFGTGDSATKALDAALKAARPIFPIKTEAFF